MARILILVGTESGNAGMAADFLQEELEALGHEIEVMREGTAAEADFPSRETVLVCTSTHGSGELPDNLTPMHDSLVAARPDFSHLGYGVIALGDQTYANSFCQAGKTMDRLFADLGADRIGERLEIDACTQPLADEAAVAWVKDWIGLL